MQRIEMRWKAVCLVVATAFFGAEAPAAWADNVIDDCNQSCEDDCGVDPDCKEATNGKCVLGNDVSCGTGDGPILLVSGNDLDMQGYDIECTDASCNYSAISMNDSGSKVTSDGSEDDGESVISGPFVTVISCNGKANSIVEDVTVFDGIIGVGLCKTVRNTVVGPSSQIIFGGNIGIYSAGISNADSISDNYVSGRTTPILHQGTTDIDILRNVIHTDSANQAIYLGQGQTSFDGLVKSNVLFSVGAGPSAVLFDLPSTDDATYEGNFCDEDHPDCADCISDGRCEPLTSPFVGN